MAKKSQLQKVIDMLQAEIDADMLKLNAKAEYLNTFKEQVRQTTLRKMFKVEKTA